MHVCRCIDPIMLLTHTSAIQRHSDENNVPSVQSRELTATVQSIPNTFMNGALSATYNARSPSSHRLHSLSSLHKTGRLCARRRWWPIHRLDGSPQHCPGMVSSEYPQRIAAILLHTFKPSVRSHRPQHRLDAARLHDCRLDLSAVGHRDVRQRKAAALLHTRGPACAPIARITASMPPADATAALRSLLL